MGGFLNLGIIFFFCTVGRFQLDLHSNNMQALFVASQTPWGNEKFGSKEKLSSANTSEKQKLECSVLRLPEACGLCSLQLSKCLWFARSAVGRRGERKCEARNSPAHRINDVQPVL